MVDEVDHTYVRYLIQGRAIGTRPCNDRTAGIQPPKSCPPKIIPVQISIVLVRYTEYERAQQ